MGKKGTKRKTRWRALPLGEEDGGSGNEEETMDEDQSTTSSVVGQGSNNYRSNPALFRMGEKPFRQARRFPYDNFRHREPLIKLESKTFDEEEYTKITTPRQDVLFKKGYFGKKRESSVEEIIHNNTGEMEGEETVMDQIIITNGFVDERGHYLVNGSSYEIYDPYTNTVTVVVGPPPYANGVSPPVLAAVSCQPVPLQPVDWYPPGTEWPNQGTAWTPTYHQPPYSDSLSSPGQSSESTPTSAGSEGQSHNMYHHPSYIPLPHGYVYGEPPVYNANGISHQDSVNSTTEVMCSKDNSLDQKLKKTRRKSEESTTKENVTESDAKTQNNFQSTAIETTKTSTSIQNSNSSLEDNKKEQNGTQTLSNSTNEEQDACTVIEAKHVEKQSHSTQTNLLENLKIQQNSIQVRVKESHSTQTAPEETIPNNKMKTMNNKENEKNEANKSLSDILLSSLTKNEQEPKVPTKPVNNNNINVNNNSRMKDYHKTSPRKSQEESPRRIYQKRTNFSDERNKLRVENIEKTDEKPIMRSIETSPIKTSYAKKVMNGLENGNEKVLNGSVQITNVKRPVMNGSNGVMNGSNTVMNGSNSVMNGTSQFHNGNKTPLVNGNNKEVFENKRNQNNWRNKSYERPRFNRSSSNGKSSRESSFREKKVHLDKIPDKQVETSKEVANESRNHSEKSSTVSELSSPTELSSGQNTPPEKLIVKKMEQKIANEINKSFEEKLKQNLEERKEEVKEEVIEENEVKDVEVAQEQTPNNKSKKQAKKKNKAKEEEKVKETPKSNKSKKKKKQIDESKDEYDYSNQEIPFLPSFMQRKPDDFLFNGKAQESDLINDIDSLLTADDDDILKSLGISDDKLNLSKLPLSSGFLKMLPTFNRDRPKFKFDDCFASTSTKQWHSDLFTKTNITNMKSTKPEEFFASIVENPSNNINSNNNSDVVRTDNKVKKDGTKNGKKEILIDTETDKIETVKETNHGAQVIVKKSISIPKTGYKINKNNLKCKVNPTEKVEVEVKEEKKNEVEEVKLGIVEAVNTWLQEQGDSEKVLSVNSLPQSFDKIESEDDGVDEDPENQKNGLGNPLHVISVNDNKGEDDCTRVAAKKIKNTRRYRSSSLDAKLSDMKIKKFLTESANYCQDLIGDVKNGFSPNVEFAREELCDPKESVRKYYALSPSMVPRKKIEDSDSENEVFDVLEYKFVKQEGRKLRDGNGNLSITDSGVHSDSESCEGNKGNRDGIEHQQVPNKEVCNCKLQ